MEKRDLKRISSVKSYKQRNRGRNDYLKGRLIFYG